jgi:hypothetical protein
MSIDEKEKQKTAPHSKESEMMVLGCMLNSVNGLHIAAESLEESDFFFTEHKIIFRVLKSAYNSDKPVDVHLVCEDLTRQDKLPSVGGAAYVTALAQYSGTSAYIEAYAENLKKLTSRRMLMEFGQDIAQRALSEEDPQKTLTKAQETLKRIEKGSTTQDNFPIKFLNQFEQNFLLVTPPKKPMLLEYATEEGITTGFLPKGIVAMLVGAGGIGKTHLLAQLAISVATGTHWLETFTTTEHCGNEKKGNVFFGLGENQYDDIHRVLYKASQELRKHQPDILEKDPLMEASKRIAAFSFCGQQAAFIENKKPSLYFRQFKMKLKDTAPKEGWSLIILDPVSRLMGADAETDNAAATQFIALLEELIIDLPGNPTILFAHHKSKAAITTKDPDQTAARGSSALTDGVRWQCDFSKKDNTTNIIKMTKSNFTAPLGEIYIRKEHDGYIKKAVNENSSQGNISDQNEPGKEEYNRGNNIKKRQK